MNILILNGSPKGKYSTTLHTCLYLQKHFTEHEFTILDVGRQIKSLEKDFTPAIGAIRNADVLLFSYPVYTFLAPSQLHRFIELLKQSGEDISGKTATQITTSKHFYDTTAHKYIEDNCADLGLKFIEGLSADMDDLLEEQGRKQALDWFRMFLWNMGKGYFKAPDIFVEDFVPVEASGRSALGGKSSSKRAVIVADIREEDTLLKGMVECFRTIFPYACDIVNIEDFPFMGGCISCFNCSTSGKCIYKDGFDEFLREKIQKHDAIIYAFSIRDHSMGARFKMYDDRQFCNGHRTVTMGTPFGYIIDGNYTQEKNLRTLIEARAQVGGNFLAGVCTDEWDTGAGLQRLSDSICYAMENEVVMPQNFHGVGGMKIFRDLIFLMRGMMRADHKFFKSHGQYDFPQKKWGISMKMYLVGWLMGNRKLKAKMGNKMNEGMIGPYREVVEKY